LTPPDLAATVRAAVPTTPDVIRALFEESIRVKRIFLDEQAEPLARAGDLLVDAVRGGHKVLLFGNGGSAADAQHIAAEFVGRLLRERRPLPALALTTDTSAITAIGNDYGYDEVFARQVRALGAPGDVAIAISTSGKSPSVLRAVEACHAIGVRVVGLTGGDGGALVGMADVALRVSASRISNRIQETHILVGHVLCELVDRALFGDPE
jgi:D-sedoheptulose 7-phosphate isomerase